MVGMLEHRGPDGEGYHLEESIGLGFCRLAIIDLDGGQQPLCTRDERSWLVANCEIYNYRELRSQLQAKGHSFKTACDSEVILHAYEEWQELCVERLRGIFAFGVWDRRRRRLFLARDRSGIKPLYFAEHGGRFRFASEAKGILVDPRFPRQLDVAGCLAPSEIDETHERTAFVGVRQLGAGCWLSVDSRGVSVRRYWTYSPSVDLGRCLERDAVGRLRRELHDVVGMQLMAEVPLGAYLSGGVDSSAVVAAMTRHGQRGMTAFTTTFANTESEDSHYAKRLARSLAVKQRLVHCAVNKHTLSLLPQVAWLAEGEFDLAYVSRYQLALAARERGIKVILTGQGIDEILTGYEPTFAHFARFSVLDAMARRGLSFSNALSFACSEDLRAELSTPYGSGAWQSAEVNAVNWRLRYDHAQLSRGLLRFEDRMGMGANVEVRVPLLDHRLVELCAAIPHGSRQRLLSGKAVLRRAVRPWLPEGLADRPKFAFNVHAPSVARTVLASRSSETEGLRHLMSDRVIAQRGYFDPARCRELRRLGFYRELDRIFSVQLLDQVFVQNFGQPNRPPSRVRRHVPREVNAGPRLAKY